MTVTIADLIKLVRRINRLTNSPMTYSDDSGKALPNHYHLDNAYGGYSLYRTCSDGLGVHDIFKVGHVSKPLLYKLLCAYGEGLAQMQKEIHNQKPHYIHISDFCDNETFEQTLRLIGKERDPDNPKKDYSYIKVLILGAE